jgi:lysophospholipase L1-like esterase
MKTIVCYGDSNTWGADAATGGRHPIGVRWTSVLASDLGNGYRVCEEGLNGRTTNLDDLNELNRNGFRHLPVVLETHDPIDVITIMLGTNDLKTRFNRRPADSAQAAGLLCDIARTMRVGPNGGTAKVLMIAPPVVIEMGDLAGLFDGAIEKSKQFAREYSIWAKRQDIDFLDAGSTVVSDPLDGIHLDAENHIKLGHAIAAKVREMIG